MYSFKEMSLFWTAVFLLLCQTMIVFALTEDAADIMNRTTDRYLPGVDFRCFSRTLHDFDNFNGTDFIRLGYAAEIAWTVKKPGCTAFSRHSVLYPPLTGMDPMMPFYINTLHQGFAITPRDTNHLSARTPVRRRKEYCATIRLIAPSYLDYWERLHSDSDICMKIVETVTNCIMFRQVRDMFISKLYEKLCLDEDGCYNVMDYYEEDLPYCVKYSAINKFKNSSVGSWHRTIINYCKLTAVVYGGEDSKYDLKLITQKGRKRENLRQMCLYLKYRLLPEEGKEQEIPEEIMGDYDTSDQETTIGTETRIGISIFITATYCNMMLIAIAHA